MFDLERQVQRRDGASQSIHPTGLTGGHSPTHRGPMPQPQVQDRFPKQEEAKLGSHSTYSLSQEGGPITITQRDAVFTWGGFSHSRSPFINDPILGYGIESSEGWVTAPVVHRANEGAGVGAHLRSEMPLQLSLPPPKHLGKVNHALSTSFLFLEAILRPGPGHTWAHTA